MHMNIHYHPLFSYFPHDLYPSREWEWDLQMNFCLEILFLHKFSFEIKVKITQIFYLFCVHKNHTNLVTITRCHIFKFIWIQIVNIVWHQHYKPSLYYGTLWYHSSEILMLLAAKKKKRKKQHKLNENVTHKKNVQ